MKSALLIDDDESVIASVSTSLIGFAKKQAHTMTKAIEALQAHEFDVVFLDLQLPDSSPERTLEMLPMLRRLAGNAALILMTGYTSQIGNAKFAVDCVLQKPFHSGHIREALQTAQLAQTRTECVTGQCERMAKTLLAFT
jgi:ActR/RegA family two-component response regulator